MRIKITKAERGSIIATGELFIGVEFGIFDGDEHVAERKLAFPVDTSEENIGMELEKYLRAYETEAETSAKRLIEDKNNTEIDTTIKNLSGVEIK